MIDTHSHLLPGLDDGSPDVASSLRMAAAAAAAGVTTVVCTPHLREFDASFLAHAQEVLIEFRRSLSEAGVALRLLMGFEVDVSVLASVSDEQMRLLTVEGSDGLVLVEVPHWGWPVRFLGTIFHLRTAGFTPLLAHPERNDRIQRDPGLLKDCIAAGAVAQATAASLNGGFGRAGTAAFVRHLTAGYVGVLASDAHFHRRASWSVATVVESLGRRLSENEIDILVRTNPERLLRGESPLPVTSHAAHPGVISREGSDLRAAVSVVEPDDIVLAQIVSRLYLDDVERIRPRVLDPVRSVLGDVGRLIGGKPEGSIAADDVRDALDDDPVLCSVVMQLQAETGSRLHHDVLHLVTVAAVDRIEPAPRPVDL